MSRLLRMLSMLVRENLIAGELQRKPEELLVMDLEEQVAAWHEQGAEGGSIAPIYHLNALACSRLAPEGGTVVDLGCGSGQYAAYLARCRPDLRIIGIDLAERMVATGNAALRRAGIADRVELRLGDMTSFTRQVPEEVVLVSSVFSIHHLPTIALVEQCFREMSAARRRSKCAVWIFDLVRPAHRTTALAYPEVFTPEAPRAFKEDSTNSLIAAYSQAELDQAVRACFPGESVHGARSRLLALYQAFWLEGSGSATADAPARGVAMEAGPPGAAGARYELLRRVLPGVPR